MKHQSGMTLLEVTVVILVFLSLISILFIGARTWKKGADRAGCILNIRNVQQAARSHANMNELAIGDTLLSTSLMSNANTRLYTNNTNKIAIGADLPTTPLADADKLYMANTPLCPGDKSDYTYLAVVPAIGTLYASCNNALDNASHIPATHGTW